MFYDGTRSMTGTKIKSTITRKPVRFILFSTLFFCVFNGCSTPFFPTDNEFLLHFPGTERKSDKIEGVLRPWERMALIKEKGEKGKNASDENKEILILQLAQEYNRSQDPNIRRSSIDALAKITSNKASQDAEKIYTIALNDETLGVRLSAVDAFGQYCYETKKSFDNTPMRKTALDQLIKLYRQSAYLITPGSDKDNEIRKDVRLAILRNLAKFPEDLSPELPVVLREALVGERLDDGALQVSAMKTLEKITHKKYGLNAEKWTAYLDYQSGKLNSAPAELSAAERMPQLNLPMFK